MRLHDTALGQVAELTQRDPGRMSMYICGPTVYGDPHLGHGRFVLVFDVLRRYLEWSGLDVRYVSNVTDIDDKIINRANREGRSADDVARQYEEVWYEVIDRLGVRRPDEDPHATAYVDEMVALVDRLVGAGAAYTTATGVYLSVSSVPDYGLLARQPLETLRAGARVEIDEDKRSPLDFALWKLAKPGEPSWPSPWGEGRPGWHTECVVMSLDLLGEDFDLHGGGQDLSFPHHENERAQAVAGHYTFARRWAHNGMVEVGGEKMSKSLGNYTTLVELLANHDARAYRMLVLQSHWRAPVEVTATTLSHATNSLAGLDDFTRRTAGLAADTVDAGLRGPNAMDGLRDPNAVDGLRGLNANPGLRDPNAVDGLRGLNAVDGLRGLNAVEVLERFRERMDDDLDTPRAMALLFDTVRQANKALDEGDARTAAGLAAAVREMAAAVGLDLHGSVEVPADVAALVDQREQARKARDYAAADALRDDLAARGWTVEDTPQGPRVHPIP